MKKEEFYKKGWFFIFKYYCHGKIFSTNEECGLKIGNKSKVKTIL
jgi:hypothetical protein